MTKTSVFVLLLLAATNMVAQSVTYTYDKAGNRTARVISMNNSPAPPKGTEEKEVQPSFPDMIAKREVIIYPNPTKGLLTVEIKDYTAETKAEYRLTDMSGRTIIDRKAKSGNEILDLSRQVTGVYLLQISINGESVVWKIVKE